MTAPSNGVTLLAVDGNSLAHRAWHAITGSDDEAGEFVAAGVIGLMASVWDLGPYDGLVVAFDHADNHRKHHNPTYKAGRTTDPDLHERLADLHERLGHLGVPTVIEQGLEADDLLAAITGAATARGWRTDVLSGDRDLNALVDDRVRLLRPRATMSDLLVTTTRVVVSEYGVYPGQYHDYAALRGDPSDGLPGVEGIGAKSAAVLLADFDDLDELYANLCYLPTKYERALRTGHDRAFANRSLMRPMTATTGMAALLDRAARIDLDAVVAVLEDLGMDDSGLARAARRLVLARQRAATPRPDEVPLPDEPLPESPAATFREVPATGPVPDQFATAGIPTDGPMFVDQPDDVTQAALF